MPTILIIDDDPDIIQYLTTFFEDSGYSTVSAVDGEDAINKIGAQKPDLITLDIIMPNQTGVKFYRTIKADESLKDIPVIIISGVTRYKELFRRNHKTLPKPKAFIEKPIDRNQVLEKVRELIG
ncbi:response regulator [candidate division KSB1 bacterium]